MNVRTPIDRLRDACVALGVAPLVDEVAGRLLAFLDAMAVEPQNLTATDLLADGIERHLADSLSGLLVPVVAGARALVDLGSGGGFPGIPLAMTCPECAVTLVESERSKADWLARASRDLPNVRVVGERTETLARIEREQWPVATARALAPLPALVELAAPLVEVGGVLVAWRGPRDADEERRAETAAAGVGFAPGPVMAVASFGADARHLYQYHKVAPTPERYPRRPGRATKRPLA